MYESSNRERHNVFADMPQWDTSRDYVLGADSVIYSLSQVGDYQSTGIGNIVEIQSGIVNGGNAGNIWNNSS